MGVCVGTTMMTEARDFKLRKEYSFFRQKQSIPVPDRRSAFYIAASVRYGSMNFSKGGMGCHLRNYSQWIFGQ